MSRTMSPLVLSYKGLSPDEELRAWAAEGLLGGIVIFKDNAADERALQESIRQLRLASPHELRIMVDEEGGRVRRLPDAPASMPDLRDLQNRPPQDAATAYSGVARRLRDLGIDTLLAPVADVGGTAGDWLRSRTYSDDPQAVAAMVTAVVPAVQSLGVHACAKHFPGMGSVTLDPHRHHVECQLTPNAWEGRDSIPFRTAITSRVDMILVAHQVMRGFGDSLPACLSLSIVDALLRRQLGFTGLILTDDLAMDAISREYTIEDAFGLALEAGADLVLICNDRELQRRTITDWRRRRMVS